MGSYSFKYLQSRASQFGSLLLTIFVISLMISYCALHFMWMNSLGGTSIQVVQELKIASTTVYAIVVACGFFSLTQVSKTTIDKMSRDFSQWRLLGFTGREAQVLQLWILFILSIIGGILGAIVAGFSAHYVLPKLTQMALTGVMGEINFPAYGFSLLGVIFAILASICTNILVGIYGSMAVKRISPLMLLRNQSVALSSRCPKLRIAFSVILAGFSILLTCCIPLIYNLNGGAESFYTIFLYIGVGLSLSVYLIIDFGGVLLVGGIRKSSPRKLISALVMQNYTTVRGALNSLFIGVTFGALMMLTTRGVGAYVQKLNSSVTINYSDTMFVVLIVVIISITTGAALLNLSSKESEQVFCYALKQGMTYDECIQLAVKDSVLLMGTLILQALIPNIVLSVIISFATGTALTPLLVLTAGVYCCSFLLFAAIRFVRSYSSIKLVYVSGARSYSVN